MKNQRIGVFGLMVSIVAVLVFTNCSKKEDGDESSVGASDLSTYASMMAEELVMASPTAQKSGRSLNKSAENAFTVPDAEDAPSDKVEALEALLDETAPASCAISITLSSAGNANCYGPNVNYANHEFDNSTNQWPGGDLGIWEESTVDGEACISAQLNSQIRGAASLIDMAQFISAGMGCVANKESLDMPAEGGSLDLGSYLSGMVTVNSTALTVSAASISRETNDADGNAVYVTTLDGSLGSETISIRIKHVPTATDDSTNKGKISVKYVHGQTDGASLEYEKTSATAAKMLLKKINFSAGADPFVSATNYTVDFSKSWNNNANYFLAELNPADYTGTFAYAWQAGGGDSHTRVFNAKIESSGGAVTGSSFFGFGPRVQTGAGGIDGMICAWTGPDQTHTPVAEVQRQNLTETGGKFVVSGASYTVFDPVADCDADGAMTMSWNSGASTRAASSTTKNLVPIAEVTTAIGTLPTAPDNVDL